MLDQAGRCRIKILGVAGRQARSIDAPTFHGVLETSRHRTAPRDERALKSLFLGTRIPSEGLTPNTTEGLLNPILRLFKCREQDAIERIERPQRRGRFCSRLGNGCRLQQRFERIGIRARPALPDQIDQSRQRILARPVAGSPTHPISEHCAVVRLRLSTLPSAETIEKQHKGLALRGNTGSPCATDQVGELLHRQTS